MVTDGRGSQSLPTASVRAVPFAGSGPAGSAVLRATPADFRVAEDMPVAREGAGEHLWLHACKTGWTTPALAAEIAAHYGLRQRDIGYAGMKDRHAVTSQWFSLPVGAATEASAPPALAGVDWLAAERHRRKLRRGTHRGNHFRLTLRDIRGDRSAVEAALHRIGAEGVPNYFGSQRFGHDGGNLELARALFRGCRIRGFKRGLALSAARAQLFNAVLARRVAEATWNQPLAGDVMALAGSRSVFALQPGDESDPAISDRLGRFDIHPTGPLPGRGDSGATTAAAMLESEVLAAYPEETAGLGRAGVAADRRALRVCPQALDWSWLAEDVLELAFGLPRGAFATVVLRECLDTDDLGAA